MNLLYIDDNAENRSKVGDRLRPAQVDFTTIDHLTTATSFLMETGEEFDLVIFRWDRNKLAQAKCLACACDAKEVDVLIITDEQDEIEHIREFIFESPLDVVDIVESSEPVEKVIFEHIQSETKLSVEII